MITRRNMMHALCLAIIAVLVASCRPYEVLTQMDLPTAPTNLLWKKDGVTEVEKGVDMQDCSWGFEEKYREIGRMAFEEFDVCMLRKGYEYVPRGIGGGYQDVCLSRRDGVACRSVRGEKI